MLRHGGMCWTKDTPETRKALTAVGDDHTGVRLFPCYVRHQGLLGVPRRWGSERRLKVSDTMPEAEWPPFIGKYREGQEVAVGVILKSLKQHHGGIAQMRTGFGKTLVALAVAARLHTPLLVICHKEDLLGQWEKSARDFFKVQSGWIQGPRRDYQDRLVTVATIQTLYSQIDDIDFWNHWGMVVCDEGHRFPSVSFSSVVGQIPARYRLGVSATFRRPDKLDQVWGWHLGPMLFDSKSKGLPGAYRAVFGQYEIHDRDFKMRNGSLNHSAYVTAITKLPGRNELIAQQVDAAVQTGRKVLVISDRVDHLVVLNDLIKSECGYYAGTISGKPVGKEQLAESILKPVLLGTSGKIAEGTDIPQLDTLFITTPKGDVEQLVGRITRDHPGKKEPMVVDFVVRTPYNFALWNKRKKVLERLRFRKT